MTEPAKPMSEEEIADIAARTPFQGMRVGTKPPKHLWVSVTTVERDHLLAIARDHARLSAENSRLETCIAICEQTNDQLRANLDEANEQLRTYANALEDARAELAAAKDLIRRAKPDDAVCVCHLHIGGCWRCEALAACEAKP